MNKVYKLNIYLIVEEYIVIKNLYIENNNLYIKNNDQLEISKNIQKTIFGKFSKKFQSFNNLLL